MAITAGNKQAYNLYQVGPITVSFDSGDISLNRILIVNLAEVGRTVASMTYDGVAMTKIQDLHSGDYAHAEQWYLVNPAGGTNNLVINFINNASSTCKIHLIVLNGVDTDNPIGNILSGSSNFSFATSEDNSCIIDIIGGGGWGDGSSLWASDRYSGQELLGYNFLNSHYAGSSYRITTDVGTYDAAWYTGGHAGHELTPFVHLAVEILAYVAPTTTSTSISTTSSTSTTTSTTISTSTTTTLSGYDDSNYYEVADYFDPITDPYNSGKEKYFDSSDNVIDVGDYSDLFFKEYYESDSTTTSSSTTTSTTTTTTQSTSSTTTSSSTTTGTTTTSTSTTVSTTITSTLSTTLPESVILGDSCHRIPRVGRVDNTLIVLGGSCNKIPKTGKIKIS